MEETKYYRFPVGSVLIRKTGDRIEKKGKSGVWEDASNLAWRFSSGDMDLTEVSTDELTEEDLRDGHEKSPDYTRERI